MAARYALFVSVPQVVFLLSDGNACSAELAPTRRARTGALSVFNVSSLLFSVGCARENWASFWSNGLLSAASVQVLSEACSHAE